MCTDNSSAWLLILEVFQAQSRPSAKLFLQSSELGLPHPLIRRRVCLPTFGPGGRGTLAGESRGGGVLITTRGHTWWYSMYGMYFVISGLQGDVYGSGGGRTVTAVQGLLRPQHQWTPGRLFKIWFHLQFCEMGNFLTCCERFTHRILK
jgi:hypothetical protein